MNRSSAAQPPQKKNTPASKKVVLSQELMGTAREIIIVHGDAEYRLQRTKAGKLILTK